MSSYEEVTAILAQCRISHFRQAFLDNECDDSFLDIVEDGDLRELGLPLGPRVRLLKAVADRTRRGRPRAAVAVTPTRAFAPRRRRRKARRKPPSRRRRPRPRPRRGTRTTSASSAPTASRTARSRAASTSSAASASTCGGASPFAKPNRTPCARTAARRSPRSWTSGRAAPPPPPRRRGRPGAPPPPPPPRRHRRGGGAPAARGRGAEAARANAPPPRAKPARARLRAATAWRPRTRPRSLPSMRRTTPLSGRCARAPAKPRPRSVPRRGSGRARPCGAPGRQWPRWTAYVEAYAAAATGAFVDAEARALAKDRDDAAAAVISAFIGEVVAATRRDAASAALAEVAASSTPRPEGGGLEALRGVRG